MDEIVDIELHEPARSELRPLPPGVLWAFVALVIYLCCMSDLSGSRVVAAVLILATCLTGMAFYQLRWPWPLGILFGFFFWTIVLARMFSSRL